MIWKLSTGVMARPRKVSDEQVFVAAYGLMERLGPTQWTLADVAGEAGLTAGALVQRFGSKRALQVALVERFADTMPDAYASLRAEHSSPMAALYAYAARMACLAPSAERLAHHLDYLRLDLTDDEMHAHFARSAVAAEEFLVSVLTDAVSAGELRGVGDVDSLARLIEATLTGSLFTWATYQEGTATEWLERHLRSLLAPYRCENTEPSA